MATIKIFCVGTQVFVRFDTDVLYNITQATKIESNLIAPSIDFYYGIRETRECHMCKTAEECRQKYDALLDALDDDDD